MVGEGPLVRRPRSEQRRRAALPLHVNEALVADPPVFREDRGALDGQAEGHAARRVLAAAQVAPQDKVVNEVEQLKILRVADHWAEDFRHPAPPDTVAPL